MAGRSWIPKSHIQVQKEQENFVVACLSSSSIKREIWHFYVVVVQELVMEKKYTKQTYCFFDVLPAVIVVGS